MKKFLLLICILLISNSFVLAETLKTKAVRELYTSKENSSIKLKVMKNCTLDNLKLEKDFYITGIITNITKSKNFCKSATFDFTLVSYTDKNGVEHKIEPQIKGKFNGKFSPNIEKSPLNFDVNVGGIMPYGGVNGNEVFSGAKKMLKDDIEDFTDVKTSLKDEDSDLIEIDADDVLKFEF